MRKTNVLSMQFRHWVKKKVEKILHRFGYIPYRPIYTQIPPVIRYRSIEYEVQICETRKSGFKSPDISAEYWMKHEMRKEIHAGIDKFIEWDVETIGNSIRIRGEFKFLKRKIQWR